MELYSLCTTSSSSPCPDKKSKRHHQESTTTTVDRMSSSLSSYDLGAEAAFRSMSLLATGCPVTGQPVILGVRDSVHGLRLTTNVLLPPAKHIIDQLLRNSYRGPFLHKLRTLPGFIDMVDDSARERWLRTHAVSRPVLDLGDQTRASAGLLVHRCRHGLSRCSCR
jgi:hypothetical protein